MLSNRVWLQRCKRLCSMSADEWRVRGGQEIAKRWDLAISRLQLGREEKKRTSPALSSGRFFFQQEEIPVLLRCLQERLPEATEGIIAQAEKICEHRFDLLGYESVDYGKEIDWHLDAVHGKRAPLQPWFRVPYLDFEQVGDSKITWELSRHQHLVTLAKAYRLTSAAKYAQELVQQWYQWQQHNPYGLGINWSSSLEVAFRSLSWIWASQLMNGCSAVPKDFLGDISRALLINARHIERFLSTYFSPNTHLLGEAVGLFFIGTLYCDSRSAARWQHRGWEIILREAQRQVQQDGVHFEQSLYYHTYALDFFLHAKILAERNGISIPAAFDCKIEGMLSVLCRLACAGPVPSLGDDDGGRLFDSRRNRMEHMTDPLATGAVLFERPDFKSGVRVICEEAVWLCGIEGLKKFESLSNQRPASASFALETSGLYVMCSSSRTRDRLVIDAGPQATGRAGHTHADALSVQLALGGRTLLADPGTAAYVDGNGDREWFRSTSAHNTVQVDGLDQAEHAGPFAWQNLPTVSVDCWVTGDAFDLLVAAHSGYGSLPNAVSHRRHIFYLKPHFWLVRDVIDGDGWHRVDAAWHFAPGTLSTIPGGVDFSIDDKSGLALLFTTNKTCSREITREGFSPVYGRRQLSPVFRVRTDASAPIEIATLLLPMPARDSGPGSLQAFKARHNGAPVRAYLYSVPGTENYFFFADQARRWQMGPWVSDAKFLFCSTTPGGELCQFILSDGSYLDFQGRVLFAGDASVKQAEWSPETDSHQISWPDEPNTAPELLACSLQRS
jgi:hypothetical protein